MVAQNARGKPVPGKINKVKVKCFQAVRQVQKMSLEGGIPLF